VEQIRARAVIACARRTLPIIADDSAFTLRDLHRELEMDTFDILNIKSPRTGYTESLADDEALAQRAGKGIMVGSQAGSTIGTARAAIFAARPEVSTRPSCRSF
jgi:L-alanine-DL-glutamate epimerase-like enolase superfamily enzyme